MTGTLRIGVVGAGLMGTEHVTRITRRISGARVAAVIEPDADRAATAAGIAEGASAFARIEDALDADALDAVIIATPGRFHEPVLRPALDAALPILCEKPLTPDSASSLEILELEQRLDRPRIQVGFMRRFDREYAQLQQLIAEGGTGALMMLHCVHRNPSVPAGGYTQDMLINDSVVHEFDVVPWLAQSPIRNVEVRFGRPNSASEFKEPILVLMELESGVLATVEMNVNVQFGYQVATEAVLERGVARIGQPSGLELWQDGQQRRAENSSFAPRFAAAFDEQVQRWVDAVRDGRLIDGPNAWDGYRVALACEAGVRSLHEGGVVEVPATERPAFYA